MKKILILLTLILLSGCSKEEYFECKIDLDNKIENYHLNATYKVYYKDSFVTRIEKKEIYISDDEEILDYFNEYKNLEYKDLNDLYGSYIYKIKYEDEKVIMNADIDMKNTDIKKMLKNKYLSKDYVVSNKLTTGGIKLFYESKGAKCGI